MLSYRSSRISTGGFRKSLRENDADFKVSVSHLVVIPQKTRYYASHTSH